MEKKNFNACRVVLTSGNVIMYYFNGTNLLGLASAGTLANWNYAAPYADGREKFQEEAKGWACRLADCEDVECIEFI